MSTGRGIRHRTISVIQEGGSSYIASGEHSAYGQLKDKEAQEWKDSFNKKLRQSTHRLLKM